GVGGCPDNNRFGVSASLTAAAALVFLQVDSAAAVADATTAASAAIAGGDAVAAAAAWTNPLQQVVAAVEQGGDAAGPLGGAVYFTAAYAIAAVLLVPASILTLAAGYLFGAARGTAITLIAATLGASVAFLVARYVARPFVVRQLAGRLGEGRFEALDRAISVGGWRIVLLCRLSPIFPFSISNYVFGITGIGFFEYVASSSLGMLPATFAYVYLGGAGRVALDAVTDATVTTTAAAGAAAGAGSGLDPVQVGLYVVGAVATLLVTREVSSRATKALEEAAAEASADAAGAAGSVSGADGRVGKQDCSAQASSDAASAGAGGTAASAGAGGTTASADAGGIAAVPVQRVPLLVLLLVGEWGKTLILLLVLLPLLPVLVTRKLSVIRPCSVPVLFHTLHYSVVLLFLRKQ
ncbi:unnamed protein product, partial [Closterium sp. NIES-54]